MFQHDDKGRANCLDRPLFFRLPHCHLSEVNHRKKFSPLEEQNYCAKILPLISCLAIDFGLPSEKRA
jgi:hypothetical protein